MNPTGQPFQPPFSAPQPPPPDARRDLNVPGILLMIFGGVALLWDIVNFIRAIGSDRAAEMADLMRQLKVPESSWKPMVALATGPVVTVFGVIGMGLAALMLVGGLQMRQLKMYPLVVVACVVAILPCQSCCCVTLPLGIWGLVILLRPEVRAQFS